MSKRILTLFFMLVLVSAGFAQKKEVNYGQILLDTTELKKSLTLVDEFYAKRGETRYVIPSFVPFRTRFNFGFRVNDRKYFDGLTFSKGLYEKAMEGDAVAQFKLYLCGSLDFLSEDIGVNEYDMLAEAVKSGNPDAKYINALLQLSTSREFKKGRDEINNLAGNLYGPACYYLYEKERSSWNEKYHNLWNALLARYPQAYYTAGCIANDENKGAIALWFFNEAKKLGWDFTEDEDAAKALSLAQSLAWYRSVDIKDNEKWFRKYKFEGLGGNEVDADNLYSRLASADSTFKKENREIYANIFVMYVSARISSFSEIKRYKALKEIDRMAKNGNMYAQACIGELYYSGDYPNIIAYNRSLGLSLMASAVDYGLTEIAKDVASKYEAEGDQEKYLKYLAISDPQKVEEIRKENEENADSPEVLRKLAGTWRHDANSYPIITFDTQGNCVLSYVWKKSQKVYNNWIAKYTITQKGHATYRAAKNGKIYIKSLKFDPQRLTITNRKQLPQIVVNEVNNNALRFAPVPIETHLQSGELNNNTLTLGGLAPFNRIK